MEHDKIFWLPDVTNKIASIYWVSTESYCNELSEIVPWDHQIKFIREYWKVSFSLIFGFKCYVYETLCENCMKFCLLYEKLFWAYLTVINLEDVKWLAINSFVDCLKRRMSMCTVRVMNRCIFILGSFECIVQWPGKKTFKDFNNNKKKNKNNVWGCSRPWF